MYYLLYYMNVLNKLFEALILEIKINRIITSVDIFLN
jgi:hypothetical protein